MPSNTKLSQLPTNSSPALTDSAVGVQSPGASPQDVQVLYSKILALLAGSNTILSSQVNTATNSGAGGGTLYWINLGGIKLMWGLSNVDTSGTSGSFVAFSLPAFFSSIQAIFASPVTPTSTGSVYCEVDSYSTSAVSVKTTSASNQSCAVSLFIIGA